ncbi:MAG: RICIN domain-containing protein [Ignavibacteria bacterium]|jgi:hypothetical protein
MLTINDGIYYKLVHKSDNRVLDGKDSTDEVYLNEWNGGDYQRWTLESVGDGWYKIVHKSDNRVLDGKNSTDEVYLNEWNGGDYQKWAFKSVGDGWCKIVHKSDGRVLDGKDSTDEVYLNEWNEGDYQKWKLEVATVDWNMIIEDIEYDNVKEPKDTYPVEVFTDLEVENSSGATITKSIEKSMTKESTFEWGFTETLAVGITTGYEAKVPLFGGAETELSVEFTMEAHQTSTVSKSETYVMSDSIEVPPNTTVYVTGYFDWSDDITYPFTSLVLVSGTADTTEGDRKLTTTEIKSILKSQGFNGEVQQERENEVVVSIKGNFSGCFGMSSHTTLKPLT